MWTIAFLGVFFAQQTNARNPMHGQFSGAPHARFGGRPHPHPHHRSEEAISMAPLSKIPFTETHTNAGFLEIAASMPGVSSNNIRLNLLDGKLVVEASRPRVSNHGRASSFSNRDTLVDFVKKIFDVPPATRKGDVKISFQRNELKIQVPDRQAGHAAQSTRQTPKPLIKTLNKEKKKPSDQNTKESKGTKNSKLKLKQFQQKKLQQKKLRGLQRQHKALTATKTKTKTALPAIPEEEALEFVSYENYEPSMPKSLEATSGYYTNRGEFQPY